MTSCASKAMYETRAEANRIAKTHKHHNGGNPRAYRCPTCDGWHLTTKSKAAVRTIRTFRGLS